MKSNYSPIFIVFPDMTLGGIQKKVIDIIHTIHQTHPKQKIILCLRFHRGIFLSQIPKDVSVISPSFHTPKFDTIWFIIWLVWQTFHLHPKVILAFLDLGAIPSLIAAKCVFWRRIPVIIGEDILTSKHVYTETFPKIRLWLIKTLYPNARQILVQTQVQKNDLDNILKTKNSSLVRVSPNWLPLEYKPIPTPQKKDIDILFVGRFDPQKNLFLFLEIVSVLQKSFPKLRVTMVGDGPDNSHLKSFARKKRLRVSFVPPTLDVKSYYLRSKIFLLTSSYEGFPLTVLEAAACYCLPVPRDLPEILTFFGQKSPLIFHSRDEAVAILKRCLISKDTNIKLLKSIQKKVFISQNHYLSEFINPILNVSS